MSVDNERLLEAGQALGHVLHVGFSDLSQAERAFVLQMCLQQELNPPSEHGITYDEFEQLFEEVKAGEGVHDIGAPQAR